MKKFYITCGDLRICMHGPNEYDTVLMVFAKYYHPNLNLNKVIKVNERGHGIKGGLIYSTKDILTRCGFEY